MKLDIRNRDMTKPITFKQMWLAEQYQKLRRVFSQEDISNEELKMYLLKKFEGRYQATGRFFNNATRKNEIMTLEQFVNVYLNTAVILTGYACLYKTQKDSVNISALALEFLLNQRKVFKKKMEASEHGSDEYIYYRILQLTYKLLANSYYGILGEKNSVFYNPFVQNSITRSGQTIITNSIVSLENFLGNNVSFFDTDDMINFVNNVCSEKPVHSILNYIDKPITADELIQYLNYHCEEGVCLNQEILADIVGKLTEEQISRVYYKNQVLKLTENSFFQEKLRVMSQSVYEDSVPKEIEDDLAEFRELIIEFCYLDVLTEDRYRRAMKSYRNTVITIDTDSNFINIHRYITTEMTRLGYDLKDQTKDTTIMNIYVNVITEVLKKMFWTMTTNMGIPDTHKEIINMKSEFVYRRIMLTKNKKSYAGLITAELGKPLRKPQLDIKGLSIKKTTMPKKLRKELTAILEEDILRAEKISLRKIIRKYDDLGKQIEISLKNGNIEYLLPKNAAIMESYKAPDTIEAIRAVLIWNALEPENQIIPPEKINMIKLKANLADTIVQFNDFKQLSAIKIKNPQVIEEMKQKYMEIFTPELLHLLLENPDKFEAIAKTVYNLNTTNVKLDISRFGLSCVAIPKSVEKIPEYLIPFIDFNTMVSNNMSNGYILLESLGIYCTEVKQTKYKSNLLSISI